MNRLSHQIYFAKPEFINKSLDLRYIPEFDITQHSQFLLFIVDKASL